MLTLDAILRTTRQMTSYGEGPQFSRKLRANGGAISQGAGKCRTGTAARLDTSAAEQTGALPQATSEEGRTGVSPAINQERDNAN